MSEPVSKSDIVVLGFATAVSVFFGIVATDKGYTTERTTKNIEEKLKTVQSITIEREVSVPTIPEPRVSNVIGGLLPDVYFVTGTDDAGNETRAYLKIDGRLVEEYFR